MRALREARIRAGKLLEDVLRGKFRRRRWEVRHVGEGWTIYCDREVMGVCETQALAITLAVFLCRQRLVDHDQASELHIKGRNGKIRDSRTYGADPLGNG